MMCVRQLLGSVRGTGDDGDKICCVNVTEGVHICLFTRALPYEVQFAELIVTRYIHLFNALTIHTAERVTRPLLWCEMKFFRIMSLRRTSTSRVVTPLLSLANFLANPNTLAPPFRSSLTSAPRLAPLSDPSSNKASSPPTLDPISVCFELD